MEFVGDHLNLWHLRAMLEVSRAGGISQAAGLVNMSQPAITHALKTLETQVNARLFVRGRRGMTVTSTGSQFAFRIERALGKLNTRLPKTGRGKPFGFVERRASAAQLRTLIAIAETSSFSSAARAIGAAQPTVHRAARDLETSLEMALFEKSANAVHLTRAGERLTQNARLAFSEINQACQEIMEVVSGGSGQIRIGALPLARATFLSQAIDQALEHRPAMRVHVDDGPYTDLLMALRNGALDLLVGALRDPIPDRDVAQEVLFEDRLGVFCGPRHPLLSSIKVNQSDLRGYPWVVPRLGTPTRNFFETAFANLIADSDNALVETSSMILVRELLQSLDRITLISRAQVAAEVRKEMLCELPVPLDDAPRPIGLTFRKDWYPTDAQRDFIGALRESVSEG